MSDALSDDEKTAFAKAWDAWKAKNVAALDARTLTPGPYLENRLFLAFSEGWRASALECAELLKVRL